MMEEIVVPGTTIGLGYDIGRIASGLPDTNAIGHVVNLRESHVSHGITHRKRICISAIRAIPNAMIK
jgi:hypothetical protein